MVPPCCHLRLQERQQARPDLSSDRHGVAGVKGSETPSGTCTRVPTAPDVACATAAPEAASPGAALPARQDLSSPPRVAGSGRALLTPRAELDPRCLEG